MVRLRNSFTFYLRPKAPYNFELTVRKPAGWDLFTPFEVYENGVLWTALHVDDLLVGLRLRSVGTTNSPRVLAKAFLERRPSSEQKELAKERVAVKLGVEEDLAEFYDLAKRDRILRRTLEDLYGMHDTQFSSLFVAALLAICLQMAPLKRSNEMMDCMITKYGEEAEFDGKAVRVWPLPRDISRVSVSQLARECRLGYRAKYIVEIANVLKNERGFPSIEELGLLPREAVKEKLLELPGIGDYSADIINPHRGFPIDVWSADVFGKLFYGREPRNGRNAVERVKKEGVRRWGRWSWMAFFYVVHDLENLSRKLKISLRLS